MKSLIRKLPILVACAFCSNTVALASPATPMHFSHVSLEDGLSQNNVQSILQDCAGGLWGEASLWNQAVSWKVASSSNPDSLLNQGSIWPEGWSEGLTQSVSTNVWVDAE